MIADILALYPAHRYRMNITTLW